ncbi:MAG: DUF3810 domain-containing protein [Flavobacteriaceae bacterium]
MKFKRYHILPLFLLIQIVFWQAMAFSPDWIEHYYSQIWYAPISLFWRKFLGKISFSVGDVLYAMVILRLLYWFWSIRKTWKTKRRESLWKLVGFVSVFYFLFHLNWAGNYYRMPLFDRMNIHREYTDTNLLRFTRRLIAKTNEIQLKITHNPNQKVIYPHTQKETFLLNLNGYTHLAEQYSFLKYEAPSIKPSMFSVPLSYMGFAGYLNPFTGEAQVNDLLPMYSFPATAAHEMAHQIGYACESECNFIGFLASIKNEDEYIQYSGYAFALRYCLHQWEIRNPVLLKQLKKTIHLGVLKNYKESQVFWEQYETFIESGFKIFYDQFLKLNHQDDGLDSYSKFVNLMVNYYENKNF